MGLLYESMIKIGDMLISINILYFRQLLKIENIIWFT
jgi:hypothetical protein